MRNILYKSENIIPWDTQSAFKMSSYNTVCEDNMVFCYIKAYVHKTDLVICSYCFTEEPADYANMHLYLGVNAAAGGEIIRIDYGYNGIEATESGLPRSAVTFRSFKADDEQGFYWCGEITIDGSFIAQHSGSPLEEKSILTLNLTQSFKNGDTAALFGDVTEKEYNRATEAQAFVVLNY